MNEIDLLKQLDARATTVTAPAIDVRSAVMRELRQPPEPAGDLRLWAWSAAGACALAATMLICAAGAWETAGDPWRDLLTSLVPGLQ